MRVVSFLVVLLSFISSVNADSETQMQVGRFIQELAVKVAGRPDFLAVNEPSHPGTSALARASEGDRPVLSVIAGTGKDAANMIAGMLAGVSRQTLGAVAKTYGSGHYADFERLMGDRALAEWIVGNTEALERILVHRHRLGVRARVKDPRTGRMIEVRQFATHEEPITSLHREGVYDGSWYGPTEEDQMMLNFIVSSELIMNPSRIRDMDRFGEGVVPEWVRMSYVSDPELLESPPANPVEVAYRLVSRLTPETREDLYILTARAGLRVPAHVFSLYAEGISLMIQHVPDLAAKRAVVAVLAESAFRFFQGNFEVTAFNPEVADTHIRPRLAHAMSSEQARMAIRYLEELLFRANEVGILGEGADKSVSGYSLAGLPNLSGLYAPEHALDGRLLARSRVMETLHNLATFKRLLMAGS